MRQQSVFIMRRLLVLALGAAALFSFGCISGGDSRLVGPVQISPQRASSRILDQIRETRPAGSSFLTVQVRETTAPGLWEAMGTQTFKVVNDPNTYNNLYADETYAIAGDELVQLGTGFGGPGIIGFLLTNVDADASLDLVFVSGSGEGIKRYNLGVLDRPGYVPFDPATATASPATRPSPTPLRQRGVAFAYRDPVEVRPASGGSVDVWDANRSVRLGRLRPAGSSMAFTPAGDLPPYVKRRFLTPRM